MLEIRNLTAGYSGTDVLKTVSFTARAGQVTAVLGPNGCGKTTLLKALCGILPISSGQVLLEGEALLTLPRNRLAQKVAYLSQNRQVPEITAGRLVLHGRFPYLSYPRHYRREDFAAARAAMEAMGVEALENVPMSQLSGGQRQKVYIAMALAQDTAVVLLDEPATFLDIRHQLQLQVMARTLANQGKTVIMVSHDLSQTLGCADHVVLLRQGMLAGEGTPEQVFASGLLEDVFRVQVRRVQTESGWQYYCQER